MSDAAAHPPDLGAGRRRARAGTGPSPTSPEALYAAGSDSAFDLLRETDADASTLVVIGHNPTMAFVAELVDDGEGDDDATTGMVTRGFPTSALAVFSVDCPWSDLGPGTGRLEAFHVGRRVTAPDVVARLRAAGCVWADDEAALLEIAARRPGGAGGTRRPAGGG